jgi:UDP-N-acetylmuramate dehydrogenase
MNVKENVSLADYTTMGLGGNAAYLVEISSNQEVQEALNWAKSKQLSSIMIGGGSNIIWGDEGYKGLVIVNKILKFEIYAEDDLNYYVTIGGGEDWDMVVDRTVQASLSGIEALSLIPGSAGATPVQNVGAYGQEISQTLTALEAYDKEQDRFVTIPAADCDFAYRTSRFKTQDKGRFYICSITLHLLKTNPMPPFYAGLQSYLQTNNVTTYTPSVIREAVMNIRKAKLPDPKKDKNVGSFFSNPVVNRPKFMELRDIYPSIPSWQTEDDSIKLSAAWLIEQVGLKGYHDTETGMATWPTQPLVLVNEKARSTIDLISFKNKIVEAVNQKFGISLIQEPEFVASI